ncbi:hypothetical protein AB8738_14375, partial [Salinicoccus roseus]
LERDLVNYAVGKTIEMQVNGQKTIGKHESSLNRAKVSPFTIGHFFYLLGPSLAFIVRTVLVARGGAPVVLSRLAVGCRPGVLAF